MFRPGGAMYDVVTVKHRERGGWQIFLFGRELGGTFLHQNEAESVATWLRGAWGDCRIIVAEAEAANDLRGLRDGLQKAEDIVRGAS